MTDGKTLIDTVDSDTFTSDPGAGIECGKLDAPAEVWVETPADGPRNAYLHCGSWPGDRTKYIRADLSKAAVEAALAKAVEVATNPPLADGSSNLMLRGDEARGFGMGCSGAREAVLALISDTGALDRALEKAREEGRRELADRIEALETKLAKAVGALRVWIDFANVEGMPVSLSDLEAAELTGGQKNE